MSLITADIWEAKIRSALQVGQVFLAVVTPSYICSVWRLREWEFFEARETELRAKKLLAGGQGLIFPVLLFPLDRGHFNDEQSAFADRVRQRQWLDASTRLGGTPIRPDQVRNLAEHIIDTIAELQ